MFSTSSPQASVALFRGQDLLAAESHMAPMAASGACLELLENLLNRHSANPREIRLFVADVGPGSFTGVKVAVTLVKTLAFVVDAQVAAVSSFDLIDADATVFVPSRKGEWFVRRPGQEPERTSEAPPSNVAGFGPGIAESRYPYAGQAGLLLGGLELMAPEHLLPNYLAEPSISVPKTPYRTSSIEANGA